MLTVRRGMTMARRRTFESRGIESKCEISALVQDRSEGCENSVVASLRRDLLDDVNIDSLSSHHNISPSSSSIPTSSSFPSSSSRYSSSSLSLYGNLKVVRMFSSSNTPKKKYEQNAEAGGDRASDRVVDKENIDDILVKGMGDVRKEIIEEEKAKPEETYGQAFSRSIRNFVSDPGGSLSRTWHHVKEEASHYWLGSKLLWREMKMAKSIIFRLLEGNAITRRERLQLTRTSLDIFRLVPFALFVLIPFMEFLLPVALKLFPNMLPSTFSTKLKKEENMKKELQVRLGVASFLQETLVELAKKKRGSSSDATSANATEVLDFMEKARKGEPLPNSQVLKMASLFEDELTLANISRPQLIILCQYMALKPFGGDGILRFQLRTKMRGIKEDDRRILWEGVDSLTHGELQDACRERGMRAYGMDEASMQQQIREWLDLSIQKNTPISLLIMSRAFSLTTSSFEGSAEKLGKTISSFDEDVINEVVLSASKGEEENTVDMKLRKLESLEHQEELMDDEREEAKEARTRMEKETALLEDDKAAKQTSDSADSIVAAGEPRVDITADESTEVSSKEPYLSEESRSKSLQEFTLAEIETLADLARGSSVAREKDTLDKIKSKMTLDERIEIDKMESKEKEEAEESMAMNEVAPEDITLQGTTPTAPEVFDALSVPSSEGQQSELEVTSEKTKEAQSEQFSEESTDLAEGGRKGKNSISVRDANYLKSLYAKMVKYSNAYTPKKHDAEDKETGALRGALDKWILKTESQISKTEEALGDKLEGLDKDHDGLLHSDEIEEFVKKVMKNPNPEAATSFVKMLDRDRDGVISVKELLDYIEERRHAEEENLTSTSPASNSEKAEK